MAFRYPIILKKEKGDEALTVTFPDFPEGVTYGESVAAAIASAVDCLDEILAARIADCEEIPAPSRVGKYSVEPTVGIAAKAALYEVFGQAGIKKTVLARKMNLGENEIRRMLDPRHKTKIERIESVLAQFGKRLSLSVIDA